MHHIGRSGYGIRGIIDARNIRSGEYNMKKVGNMQCNGMLVHLQVEETKDFNVMATSEGRRFPA